MGVATFDREDTDHYSISAGPHLGNQLIFYNDDEDTLMAVSDLMSAITAIYANL